MEVKRGLRRSLRKFRSKIKLSIIRSGIGRLYRLEYVLGMLRLGDWLDGHGADGCPVIEDRIPFHQWMITSLGEDSPIDYLEFGVYKGETIALWSRGNRHPESRFFGFDTFDGLPEPWRLYNRSMDVGAYSAGGKTPEIPDSRISWIKGLFQETLAGFLAEGKLTGQRLVVHLDADLYTSTLYVLTFLHPLLRPGTVLIFDEFDCGVGEFQAFEDYTTSFRVNYRMLARTQNVAQVAFEVLPPAQTPQQ